MVQVGLLGAPLTPVTPHGNGQSTSHNWHRGYVDVLATGCLPPEMLRVTPTYSTTAQTDSEANEPTNSPETSPSRKPSPTEHEQDE